MHDPHILSRMREWGATTGQIEHKEDELGLRDIDQPTADPEWWRIHGSCEHCETRYA